MSLSSPFQNNGREHGLEPPQAPPLFWKAFHYILEHGYEGLCSFSYKSITDVGWGSLAYKSVFQNIKIYRSSSGFSMLDNLSIRKDSPHTGHSVVWKSSLYANTYNFAHNDWSETCKKKSCHTFYIVKKCFFVFFKLRLRTYPGAKPPILCSASSPSPVINYPYWESAVSDWLVFFFLFRKVYFSPCPDSFFFSWLIWE